MTQSEGGDRPAVPAQGHFGDEAFFPLIELLFFAYRDFISEPDSLLARYGFGRAHHRVIHFVGRNPGITVAALLNILRITKQSLSRVLRQLIEQGFIVQQVGARDRRQRLLYLTERGRSLHGQLSLPQRQRFRRAMGHAGPEALESFRKVLLELVNPADRAQIRQLTGQRSEASINFVPETPVRDTGTS